MVVYIRSKISLVVIVVVALAMLLAQPMLLRAQSKFPEKGGATQPAVEDEAAAQRMANLPGIRVARQAGYIEVEAKVATRDADWLELLVCEPGTREYESILTSTAKPSHIHLALLMLGLEPGNPLDWRRTRDGFQVQPPAGPRVRIECIWEEEGQTKRVPANTWVINQRMRAVMQRFVVLAFGATGIAHDSVGRVMQGQVTAKEDLFRILNQRLGQTMQGDQWLFAGSTFVQHEGRRLYMADENGTVVSLVNFGDDLLTRPTTTTNSNDMQAWTTNTPAIPPKGTAVTLRLTPVPAEGDEAAAEDADAADAAADDAEAAGPATQPAETPFVPPGQVPGKQD